MAAEPHRWAWMPALGNPSFAVAVGAALAGALVPLYANGGAARPANWWLWSAVPAAAVLVGVLIAARTGPRSRFAAVAVLGAALAVPAIWLFVLDVRSGTPGGVLPVLGLCALVVAVAMTVPAIRRAPGRATPWRTGVLPLTAVVLSGAGLLLAPAASALPENSVTAASVTAPAVPQLPTRRAWQVPAPKANASFFYDGGVVAAGAGFVTALGYPGAPSPGLAGVDGATGQLRWTYDLGPSVPAGLVASPDGAYVLAVDPGAEPQVLLAAPGALVTAVLTPRSVTYVGYRDA